MIGVESLPSHQLQILQGVVAEGTCSNPDEYLQIRIETSSSDGPPRATSGQVPDAEYCSECGPE